MIIKDRGSSDLVANVLEFNIVVSEFEHQSHYYLHYKTNTLVKGMNLLLSRAQD